MHGDDGICSIKYIRGSDGDGILLPPVLLQYYFVLIVGIKSNDGKYVLLGLGEGMIHISLRSLLSEHSYGNCHLFLSSEANHC